MKEKKVRMKFNEIAQEIAHFLLQYKFILKVKKFTNFKLQNIKKTEVDII
jgi:hypothetical protein